MKKFFFWLGVLFISALVMIRPASAVVEQVAPESNSLLSYYILNYVATTERATPYLSVAAFESTYNAVFDSLGAPEAFSTCPGGGTTYRRIVYMHWVSGGNFTKYIYPSCHVGGSVVCPTASPVYSFNAQSGMCEREVVPPPACPVVGLLHSEGFFNVGTVPTGKLLTFACVSGCKVGLNSGYVPAASSVIDGTKYYFGQAKYLHTGEVCSPDTPNFLTDFVGNLPSETCGAGQQMISMAGVTKCFDSVGDESSVDSASAVAAAQTLADAAIAKRIADAEAAAIAAGLSASAVEAAKSMAAAQLPVGSVSGANPYPASDPMYGFCAENPSAEMCKQETACDKNPNLASCAELGTISDDVPLGIKTITVSSITPVQVGGAGACPAPHAMVIKGQTYYMPFTTYCNFANGIRPIILVFAWLAAAGILVGGFRAA
ncbi:MAG: virulence factor TspB C-terminal domain-related protein [bacterium]|nr:virulence factor TspB C-terminal domain-related protein [bacterium]